MGTRLSRNSEEKKEELGKVKLGNSASRAGSSEIRETHSNGRALHLQILNGEMEGG